MIKITLPDYKQILNPSGARPPLSSKIGHNVSEAPRELSRVEYLSVMPNLRPQVGFE